MKTKFLLYFLFVTAVFSGFSQQCCQINPFGGIGGPDPAPNTAFGIDVGDINGDGYADIVFHQAYGNTYVYLYSPTTQSFVLHQTITYSSGDSWQYGLDLVDVDGDGDLDLITTPFSSSARMYVFKNNGSGTFSLFQQLNTNISAYNKGVGDIDKDGDVDVVIANAGPGLKVFKNNGSGVFSHFADVTGEGGRTVVLSDIDKDGDLDAVVATMYYGSGVRIYRNNGTGNFTLDPQILNYNSSTYHSLAVADFDNDGYPDIIAGTGSDEFHIFKNQGMLSPGSFVFVRSYKWEMGYASYYMQLRAADMNNDGMLDLICSTYSGGIQVWLATSYNFDFIPCFRSTLATYGHGMDVGDINNDGKIDIVGSCANNFLGYVFFNQGIVTGIPPQATNSGPVCENSSLQLFAFPAAAQYIWQGPDNFYSTQQNPVITNVTLSNAGTYYVHVGSQNCYGTASTQVIIYDTPDVFIGNDTTVVINSVIQFNAQVSGGSGNYQYNWAPASLLNNPHIPNPTTVPLTSSTIFYITVTDIQNNCTGTDNRYVQVSGTPLSVYVNASTTTLCEGNSVMLSATPSGGTGNYTYQWSSTPPGSYPDQQHITVQPTQTTTYNVTVNDGMSTASSSITITVNQKPSINAYSNSPYCPYETVQLFVNQAVSYQWVGPNLSSNEQNPVVGMLPAGTYNYFVTITDQNNCSNSAQVTVQVNPQPQAQASFNPDSLNLQQSNIVYMTGINTGNIIAYQWFVESSVYTGQYVQHVFQSPGIYNITLVVTNNFNCTDTAIYQYVVYLTTSTMLTNTQDILIFPNPASDFLYVNLPDGINTQSTTFHLLDITGRIIMNDLNIIFKNNLAIIDLKNLTSGLYFLHIQTTKQLYIAKIVIE